MYLAGVKVGSGQLRFLERQGFLHHFGNTKLSGHGKTPKAYFLTRKGFDLLVSETGIPAELFGSFKEVKVEAAKGKRLEEKTGKRLM
jgi:hypothetical protein